MKSQKLIFIFLIILLGSLALFPSVSLALNSYKADGDTIKYAGLVPCGKSKDKPLAPGESEEVRNPCQFCHFFVMFRGIFDFVLEIVVAIAILMFTIGGFMFFFAGGNPEMLSRARKILTTTLIGLLIIFGAWLIINVIFMFIGVADWTGLKEGWFSIKCPIKL